MLVLEFFNNLAYASFWILVPCSIIIGFVLIDNYEKRKEAKYGSSEWIDFDSRVKKWTAIIGIGWAGYLLIAAVPKPDYIIKKVVVEKEVTVWSKAEDAYVKCRNNTSLPKRHCVKLSIAASRPDIKEIVIEEPDPSYRSNIVTECVGLYKSASISIADRNKECYDRAEKIMDQL